MSTAHGLSDSYSPYEVGTGRVDVAAAINTAVRSTGSAVFGNFDWPHDPTTRPSPRRSGSPTPATWTSRSTWC